MPDLILSVLLLGSLLATAVLYWLRVAEQMHARRTEERLAEIRHATAVTRTALAERRHFA